MPVVTGAQERNGVVPGGLLFGSLDLQLLLNRITNLAGESVPLKCDAGDKVNCVAELEETFVLPRRSSPLRTIVVTPTALRLVPAGPPASMIELVILRKCVTTTDNAAVTIGRQRESYRDSLATFRWKVEVMFAAMHSSNCPIECANQFLLGCKTYMGTSHCVLAMSKVPYASFLIELYDRSARNEEGMSLMRSLTLHLSRRLLIEPSGLRTLQLSMRG